MVKRFYLLQRSASTVKRIFNVALPLKSSPNPIFDQESPLVRSGEWPALARAAAVHFVTVAENKPLSFGERLLTDIYKVFGDREAITTHSLLSELHDLEGSSWAEFGQARQPINARNLARILREYEVPTNNTIRINGGEPTKGYRRDYFLDAWERYTPHLLPADETPSTEGSTPIDPLSI